LVIRDLRWRAVRTSHFYRLHVTRSPEIALLVSSYQRPQHLRRALLSIAMQRNVAGRMEVVVTDDGSTDETPQIVAEFARSVDFPVRFTTHPHTTFQLSRCRNEGVAACAAPYLLFLDGDCILPPDHVSIHLQRRRPGVVWAGTFIRLDEETSARIDDNVIRRGEFVDWAPADKLRRLRIKGLRSLLYEWMRHPTKPRLRGNNVGIWRSDYERINGYDENFVGWGWEDDDLGRRLRRSGVRIRSILRWTCTFHLWHPTDVTVPVEGQEAHNAAYVNRQGALVRCRNGLSKRTLQDLRVKVLGSPPLTQMPQWLPSLARDGAGAPGANPEVEVVFQPGPGKFSGRAECNMLVVTDPTEAASKLARYAHVVVADYELPAPHAFYRFRLHELPNALKVVA
jgi:glycosyltransferase involved in cell wall biosynthesis